MSSVTSFLSVLSSGFSNFMPIRHISKPHPKDETNDLWRMAYCGTSYKVTMCVSLSMYMKGFFEAVKRRPTGNTYYPCTKCIQNIDGLDALKQIA